MERGIEFLRKAFDKKGFIRVRVRVKKGKKNKIRNIRLSSTDNAFILHIKEELISLGVRPVIYKIGRSYCVDIEGKAKLERFSQFIGFSDEGKKRQLEEALKPLSLQGV